MSQTHTAFILILLNALQMWTNIQLCRYCIPPKSHVTNTSYTVGGCEGKSKPSLNVMLVTINGWKDVLLR